MAVRFIGRYIPTGRIKITNSYKPPLTPSAPAWVTNLGYIGSYEEGDVVDLELVATDPDGDIVKYEAVGGEMPPGLAINQISGHIVGTVGNIAQDQNFYFTIRVTDRTGLSLEGTFNLLIQNKASQVVWSTESGSVGMPAVGTDYQNKLEAVSQ